MGLETINWYISNAINIYRHRAFDSINYEHQSQQLYVTPTQLLMLLPTQIPHLVTFFFNIPVPRK